MPELLPYTKPHHHASGEYLFSNSTVILLGHVEPAGTVPLSAVLKAPRLWLLMDSRRESSLADLLTDLCHTADKQMYGPFAVLLLEQCAPY
jgi:hypothetical protein